MVMVPGELYDVWVALGPRQETPTSPRAEIGSIRLTLQYRQNFIYSSEVYEPLKALLFSSLKMKVSEMLETLIVKVRTLF